MITDSDIKKLRAIFPTKDDFKNEFAKYATKKDLQTELTKYATKKDMQNLSDEIVKTMTEMFSHVYEKLDAIIGKFEIHDDKIDSHEKRIGRLENKVFPTTS